MNKILNVPKVIQKYDYDCGACALQSVLKFYGINKSNKKIIELLKIKPELGADIPKIVNVAKIYGINVVSKENMRISDLKRALDKKYIILVEIQIYKDENISWRKSNIYGHYCVVIGYDDKNLYLVDPLYKKRKQLSYKEMNERWHGFATVSKIYNHWGMICKGVPNFKTNDVEHFQ